MGRHSRRARGAARLCAALGGDPPRPAGAAVTPLRDHRGDRLRRPGAARSGARRGECDVRALARQPQEPARRASSGSPATWPTRAALARLVAGAEAVIHVAGVVNAPDAAGFEAGNVAGTLDLVEAALAGRVPRFDPRFLALRARAAACRTMARPSSRASGSSWRARSTGPWSARRRSTVRATARCSTCSGSPRPGRRARCRRAGG